MTPERLAQPDIAHAAASRALELDEAIAEAHASLPYIKFRFDWDWIGAEAEFRRALELNPGLAPVRQRYAMFLATMGRTDEAIASHKTFELPSIREVIDTR